jgi:hypothetical protein
MQANFNPMPYDYMPGMNDQFGSVDFGMHDMFPDSLRDNTFGEPGDLFVDLDHLLDGKPFDSSNNDDYTSVGNL